MLDYLQVIFWSITYVLVIVAGILSKNIRKVSMPYLAGVLNVAWEICAFTRYGSWAHILWLGLDSVIVYFNFIYVKTTKGRVGYVLSIIATTLVLRCVFTFSSGMLISVFVIDFIMSASYLSAYKSLSPRLKLPIAITKLMGDAFAGLYYTPYSWAVAILAFLVFVCNGLYLYWCLQKST